jgi:hypothetical protein
VVWPFGLKTKDFYAEPACCRQISDKHQQVVRDLQHQCKQAVCYPQTGPKTDVWPTVETPSQPTDMFVVVSATFRLLYTVIILGHNRRKVIHFDVTQNPTQVWLAHQMTEAFPWDTAPRYLLRDRDASYGQESRPIHPLSAGKIIAFPQVGGLHHRYERRAA